MPGLQLPAEPGEAPRPLDGLAPEVILPWEGADPDFGGRSGKGTVAWLHSSACSETVETASQSEARTFPLRRHVRAKVQNGGLQDRLRCTERGSVFRLQTQKHHEQPLEYTKLFNNEFPAPAESPGRFNTHFLGLLKRPMGADNLATGRTHTGVFGHYL